MPKMGVGRRYKVKRGPVRSRAKPPSSGAPTNGRQIAAAGESKPEPLKIDDLANEFEIGDRDALNAAIGRAFWAMVEKSDGMLDFREGDTLDELAEALESSIKLLADSLNSNRLTAYWRRCATAGRVPYFPDLVRHLQIIQRCAAEAHRKREQISGPLPSRPDLLAAADVLTVYWKTELKREFTRNHKWAKGKNGQLEPVPSGQLFVFRVIQTFPYVTLRELRGALRRGSGSRRS